MHCQAMEMRRAMSELVSRRVLAQPNSKFPQSDLQLLAISTRITELFYSVSDIQTRIFGTPASP
jgi:hypothetical protein